MYEDFVPERLAKLRTQKGVSARDMSLSLGQTNNYINNIENKKSLPAMQSFFYICEYLGVTPQEFFDEGNDNPEALREFITEAPFPQTCHCIAPPMSAASIPAFRDCPVGSGNGVEHKLSVCVPDTVAVLVQLIHPALL